MLVSYHHDQRDSGWRKREDSGHGLSPSSAEIAGGLLSAPKIDAFAFRVFSEA